MRFVGKAPWAVGDQMLISATNMITTVMLARGLSPDAFGLFVLIFSALLFANSIQSGLIHQAHNVLGATRKGDDYRVYTTTTAATQIGLSIIAAILALIAAGGAYALDYECAPLLLALAPTIFAWQIQEFVRRVLYTEHRIAAAFVNDIVCYGGQTLVIAWLWWTKSLTAENAMIAIGATSMAASLLGAWQIRASLIRRIDKAVIAENWHYGKWLSGGEIATVWLSSQLFVILTASLVGAAAAGVLRAGYTLFGPARMLSTVFRTMLPSRFAKALAADDGPPLKQQMRSAFITVILVMGGYCLLVAIFANPIMHLVFGDAYQGYGSVIALLALATFISYLTMVVVAALKASRMTREVFTYRVAASLISIPFGVALIYFFGIHGAVLGMTVTYVVVAILYHRVYRKVLSQKTSTDTEIQPS